MPLSRKSYERAVYAGAALAGRSYLGRQLKRMYGASRKRRKRAIRSYVPRAMISGFPKQKVVSFRYSKQITLNPSTGSVANHLFVANGPYAPDLTGSSTRQPLWWDTWSTVYKRYTVLGSRIRVIYTPIGSSNPGGTVGIQLQKSSTANPYTNIDTYFESKFTKLGIIAGNQSTNLLSYKNSVRHKMSTRKFFGVSNVKDNDTLAAIMTNANPTEKCYFNVFYLAHDATSDPLTANFRVVIDYICHLSDPLLTDES